MRHVVIGTAGHIDHGKTHLIKALTGVNTDRLKEEQQRGITIDIGFAPLPLGDALTVGFVDVPGHEKFVKNMLAGIWGIDLVMMVIAADESIKPQTREHFDICSLLGISGGLIALTKVDLVDSDLADLASMEIRDLVRGSFLEAAPIVPVSAKTGAGLDRLKQEIEAASLQVSPSRGASLLRLPVDRAFAMRGFGAVVTGTLVSGSVAVGDELLVYPEGFPCRVRRLEVHHAEVQAAHAGQRTAVNLAGIDASSVARGCVLARPGQMRPSSLLDVRLRLLGGARAGLRDLSRVRFHQGTSELLARVRLLEGRPLDPGGETFAQIRLERPGCCLPGDRFVIRRYSPAITIGGGVVLDAHPVKHRGAVHRDLMARLESLQIAAPVDSLGTVLEAEPAGLPVVELAVRTGRTPAEVFDLLAPALAAGTVLRAGEGATGAVVIHAGAAGAMERRVAAELSAYHAANPLRPGMPREELRARAMAGAGADVTRLVLDRLAARGELGQQRDTVSLAAHQVTLGPEDERLIRRVEEAFEAGGLNPPSPQELSSAVGGAADRIEKMLHLLLSSGRLIRIRDGKVFHSGAIESLKGRLWAMLPGRRVIDIGAFKELTGTSRKNAIPLLEHLDAVRVTRRVGSDREILPPSGG